MGSPLAWRQPWASGNGPNHAPIPPPAHPTWDLEKVIRGALEEDSAGIGDLTTLSTIPEATQAVGTFLVKDDGVLAGLAVADLVFALVDPGLKVEWTGKDGDVVKPGTVFGTVTGSARSILIAERIALNYMQRMCGIATTTAGFVRAAKGSDAKVLCTRKTVPGLRVTDKWAHVIGGGMCHRVGLFDMVLIKDNHVDCAGGITSAISQAEGYLQERGLETPIEIETRTLDEVEEVLQYVRQHPGTLLKRILLDNMVKRLTPDTVDVSMLREAVVKVAGLVPTEASGNVTQATVGAIAATGVTHVSVGAVTHSVIALDISLKVKIV